MVSKRTLTILGVLINMGYRVGFIPYKLNKEGTSMKFDSGPLTNIKFWTHLVSLFLYQIFLGYQTVHTVANPELNGSQKARGVFLFVLYVGINFNHYMTVANYGLYHHFFNQCLSTTSELRRITENCRYSYDNEADRRRDIKKFDKMNRNAVIGGIFSCTMAAVARVVKVFAKPGSPELLTSVFASPRTIPLGLKLGIALVQFSVAGFHCYTIALHGCIIITYIFAVLPVLSDLKLRKFRASTENRAGMANTIRLVTNHLYVLQGKFNKVYQMWPLGCELICVSVAIFRLCLGAILASLKDFILGVSVLISLLMFFNGFAELHDMFIEALATWRVIHYPLWFRKYRISCHPVSIRVGNFFYADKRLVLTIIAIVITNTTSLVLAFKDSADH